MDESKVADVHLSHGMTAVSFSQDATLRDIIARLALDPGLRGIFLVDAKLVYTGMMMRVDLMRWARLRLRGGTGRSDIPLREIHHIVDAQKAGDLVHLDKSYSVREKDSLQTALDMMLDHEEDVVPVVDGEGRIVGDLTLAEVLLHALNSDRQSGMPAEEE